MVRLRKNGSNLRNDKYDTIYNKPNYKSLQLFCDTKSNWQTSQYNKILLTGIFGIFSQTLTQLVAQIQKEEDSHDSDENYTHYRNHKPRKKHTFRRHSTDITHTADYTDNDKPAEIYVDTNYKHYNTTIRRTEKGLQLRTTDSPPKKQKPPLPERKYKQEPLETISENKLQTLPPQLITPPLHISVWETTYHSIIHP